MSFIHILCNRGDVLFARAMCYHIHGRQIPICEWWNTILYFETDVNAILLNGYETINVKYPRDVLGDPSFIYSPPYSLVNMESVQFALLLVFSLT